MALSMKSTDWLASGNSRMMIFLLTMSTNWRKWGAIEKRLLLPQSLCLKTVLTMIQKVRQIPFYIIATSHYIFKAEYEIFFAKERAAKVRIESL